MCEHKQRILAMIRTAFAGVVLGDGVGLRQAEGLDDYEDEYTLAAYREQDEKQDWSAIPVAELDNCYSSLSFFDADGMRFHLPAYLIADLEGRLEKADVMFHLVHLSDYSVSRFTTLSPDQREAVREFLQFIMLDPNRNFQYPMIEAALRNYWTQKQS
jgi:hypothetical protein